jgi:hypothetical protein
LGAWGLGVERNGLPRRSARRHVPLLIYCSFSFFSPDPSFAVVPIASRSTQHPPSRDTRHNVAATRQPYAPFSSPYRPSFVHLQPFRITGTIKRPSHSSRKHSIHLHMHPYTFFPLISRQSSGGTAFQTISAENIFSLSFFPSPSLFS